MFSFLQHVRPGTRSAEVPAMGPGKLGHRHVVFKPTELVAQIDIFDKHYQNSKRFARLTHENFDPFRRALARTFLRRTRLRTE